MYYSSIVNVYLKKKLQNVLVICIVVYVLNTFYNKIILKNCFTHSQEQYDI